MVHPDDQRPDDQRPDDVPSDDVQADHLTSGGVAPAETGWPGRLTVLDGLAERPLQQHAEVYQELHADLQAALAEIDGA